MRLHYLQMSSECWKLLMEQTTLRDHLAFISKNVFPNLADAEKCFLHGAFCLSFWQAMEEEEDLR